MSRITTKYIFDYRNDVKQDYNNEASVLFNKQYMTYDQFKTSSYVANKLKSNETFSIKSDKLDNYPVWRILKYICQLNYHKNTVGNYSHYSNMFGYFSEVDKPLFVINTLDSRNNGLHIDANTVMFVGCPGDRGYRITNSDVFEELKFISSGLGLELNYCNGLKSCNLLYNYAFEPELEELHFINPSLVLNECNNLTEVGLNDETRSLGSFNIYKSPISYFELPEKASWMNAGVLEECPNIYDVQPNNSRENLQSSVIVNCHNFKSSSIDISINLDPIANTITNLRIVIPNTITEIYSLVVDNFVIEHLHIKNNSSNIKYHDDFIRNCPNLKTITGDWFKGSLTDGQRQYNFYNGINFENKYNCFESDCVLKMFAYNTTTFTFPNHMSRFYNMIGRFHAEIENKNIDYKVDIKFLEEDPENPDNHYGVKYKLYELFDELVQLSDKSNNVSITLKLYNLQKYYENDVYHDFISTTRSDLNTHYNNGRVYVFNDDFGSVIY